MTLEFPSRALSPEEALRRHAGGDRSSEVLKTLSLAAWEAYHAPWEALPTESSMDEPTPLVPLPPTEIRPLAPDMLADWLEEVNFSAFQHPTRGFLVDFKFSLKSDRCIQLRLSIAGKHADILVLQWTGDKRIPPDQYLQALRLCNWWNNEYRWPRALVEQDFRYTDTNQDPPPPQEEVEAREATHSAQLMLDHQITLPKGIHPNGLHAIIDATLETSWLFWRAAHETWGL